MSATIFALINQKGGVGKTTETINLARVACLAGQRVLVVDADPQGNVTGILTEYLVRADQVGFGDVLAGLPISAAAVPGIWEGLSVVPGNPNTIKATRSLHGEHGREWRLRDMVTAARRAYDIILIDCAPSLDLHTVNALTAADKAVVITQPGKFSLDGMGQLQDTFAAVKSYYNPKLKVAGIVVNGVRDTVGHRNWLLELEGDSPWNIIGPYIPYRAIIQDAEEAGYGLDEWPRDRKIARKLHDMYASHYGELTKAPATKGR